MRRPGSRLKYVNLPPPPALFFKRARRHASSLESMGRRLRVAGVGGPEFRAPAGGAPSRRAPAAPDWAQESDPTSSGDRPRTQRPPGSTHRCKALLSELHSPTVLPLSRGPADTARDPSSSEARAARASWKLSLSPARTARGPPPLTREFCLPRPAPQAGLEAIPLRLGENARERKKGG